MTKPPTRMLDQRYKVQAQDQPQINALIYGAPGCGKTTLAATCQDHELMRDVMFLNIEGGLLSVASRGDLAAIDVRSLVELEKLFWELSKDPGPIKTIIIDSGTELQTVNIEEIIEAKISSGHRQVDSRDQINQDDYGRSSAQLKRLFRWFRDLPMNVIVTALAKEVYPKGNVEAPPTAVQPSLTGKLAESLMGYMDFVWYLYQDQGSGARKMLTQPSGIFRAKTRGAKFSTALGQVVDNPHLAVIYDLLRTAERAA